MLLGQPRPRQKRDPYIEKVVEVVARAIDPQAFKPIPKAENDIPKAFQEVHDQRVQEMEKTRTMFRLAAKRKARRAIVAYLHITDKLSPKRLAS